MSNLGFICLLICIYTISLVISHIILTAKGYEKGDALLAAILVCIMSTIVYGMCCMMYVVMARLTYPYMEWSDTFTGLFLYFIWFGSVIYSSCIWGNSPS